MALLVPATHDEYPGMPRWVKITGLVTLAVILIAIVIMLLVGGEHGPARHFSA